MIGGVTEVVIIISLLLLIGILTTASVIKIAFLNIVSAVTAQNIINYESGIMFVATTALVVVVVVGCTNCILDLLSHCY